MNTVLILVTTAIIIFITIIVIIMRKKRDEMLPRLNGALLYGLNRHTLTNKLILSGEESVQITIGQNVISDKHIKTGQGTTFLFTISPVYTTTDSVLINIKCQPPGMLVQNGQIKTMTNIFANEIFIINNLYFKYTAKHSQRK